MSFTLVLKTSVNGKPAEAFFKCPAELRSKADEVVEMFHSGKLPMESTITLGSTPACSINIDGRAMSEISWRWADVKDIWVEEGPSI